ncbi:MAG: DUF523 domain-containing protein [Firmicutes bacterium]|nr:DUF523 domain-containing protein [Bacillota bacterium]
MIIVSACLVGINARYDQKSNSHPQLIEEMRRGGLLPLCPEQLGGLPTPRIPCEIRGGTAAELLWQHQQEDEDKPVRVVNRAGKDVTAQFVKGAEEVARLADFYGVKAAVLKARSPSCGCGKIYDGSFSHQVIDGYGVTAEALLQRGVTVITEEDYTSEWMERMKTL